METPSSLKTGDSGDTPGTTFSTTSDSDDSPLSSPSSSLLSDIYNEPDHGKSRRNTQTLALFDDPNNCETAASQRPRRGTKALLQLNKQVEERSEPATEQISTTVQDVAPPAVATEQVDEQPLPVPARRSTRNRQPAVLERTPEPQPNQPKRDSKSFRSKFADESAFADEPQSPPATPAAGRQLRKRKTKETVKDDPWTPPPKENKTIAIDAPSKSRTESSAVPTKSSAMPTKSSTTPRRSARPKTKSRKQILADAAAIEESAGMSSRVIILKTSPSWFSPGGPLDRITASQHAKFSTPETSFASISERPAIGNQEQYAQPVSAPVPASSETTSTDGSSFLRTQPRQSQKFVPQEPSTITSQGTLPIPPYNHNGEVALVGQLSGLIDATQSQKRAMVEEDQTQPTQLLSQPYSKLSHSSH